MKPISQDRIDSAQKVEYNMDRTIQNIDMAEEMISETKDEEMKDTLEEKNVRRRGSLDGMKKGLDEDHGDHK